MRSEAPSDCTTKMILMIFFDCDTFWQCLRIIPMKCIRIFAETRLENVSEEFRSLQKQIKFGDVRREGKKSSKFILGEFRIG